MKRAYYLIIILLALIIPCSCSTTKSSSDQLPTVSKNMTVAEKVVLYEEARENSNDNKVLYNLAYLYIQQDRDEEALSVVKDAIELYPEYIRFYLLKALIEKRGNRLFSYRETLRSILSFDEGNIAVREYLIEELIAEERIKEAEEEARRLIIIDPKNKTALNALSINNSFFSSLTSYQREVVKAEKPMPKLDSPDYSYYFKEPLKGEANEEEQKANFYISLENSALTI